MRHAYSYRGQDFRTAFSKLGGLRALTDVPFMALTATASSEVQSSIENSLSMERPVVISQNLDRPNIFYSVGVIKSLDVSFQNTYKKTYSYSYLLLYYRRILVD